MGFQKYKQEIRKFVMFFFIDIKRSIFFLEGPRGIYGRVILFFLLRVDPPQRGNLRQPISQKLLRQISQIREVLIRLFLHLLNLKCLPLKIIFMPVLICTVPVFILMIVSASFLNLNRIFSYFSGASTRMTHQYWKKYEELSVLSSLVHPVVHFLAFLFVFVESSLTGAQNSRTSLIRLLHEHSLTSATCRMSLTSYPNLLL